MLILSRCIDDAIVVDGPAEITVLSVKGKQVRLGITAEKDVTVHRKEIQERIEREKAEREDAA